MPARRPCPGAAQIPASRQIPDARPSPAFAPVPKDHPALTVLGASDAERPAAAAGLRPLPGGDRRPILRALLWACGRKSAFPAEFRHPRFAPTLLPLTEVARCKPDAVPSGA